MRFDQLNADKYLGGLSLGICLLVAALGFVPAVAELHDLLGPYLMWLAGLGGLAAITLSWRRAYRARSWRTYLAAFLVTLGLTVTVLVAYLVLLVSQYMFWATQIEAQGLQRGIALNDVEMALARDIGIKRPDQVRVVRVEQVPYPLDNPGLKILGESLGFVGKGIVNNAQVFGYSIYVREGYALKRPKLAHELVHVLQIERSSFRVVTVQYVWELALYGYENTSAEIEAFKANKQYAE